MTLPVLDPDYAAKARLGFECQRFMAHIGAQLTVVAPGFCEIRLPYKPELTQQHGYFHAGIISTLADNAAGFAAFSLMPPGTSVLSVEFKLNLLSPGDGELLVSRGRVIKAGRTLTVCRSDVFILLGAEEKLCATALLTMMAVAARPEGPAPAAND
jgi:uncharacterized protein (TIGR00369 family)